MKKSRTNSALLNLISSFALQLSIILINIFTLKLFIETYGSYVNGLVASISQGISYMMVLEAGLGMAAIQALYEPLSQKKWKRINGVLSATKIFYNQIGFLFLLILLLFSLTYPFIIENEIPNIEITLLIIVMGGSVLLEYFFHGKLRVFLTANQKGYIVSNALIASNFLAGLVRILLMLTEVNFLLVQSIYIFTTIIRILFLSNYIKKKFPESSFRSTPSISALSKRWDALYHQLAGTIINSSSIIIISIFSGLKEASVFALYNMVFSTISNFMWMFANAVTPGFGEIITGNEKERLKKIYLEFEFIFFIVLYVIYCSMLLLIIPFLNLYTNNMNDANYINHLLPILFTVGGLLNTVRIPSNNLINAYGHFKETKNRAIIEAFIYFLISIIAVQFIGMYGVLLGSIISFAYRSFDILIYTNKNILKNTIFSSLKRIFINSLILLAIVNSFTEVVNIYVTDWISLGLISIFVLIAVSCVFLLVNAFLDIKSSKSILNRISNRKRNQ